MTPSPSRLTDMFGYLSFLPARSRSMNWNSQQFGEQFGEQFGDGFGDGFGDEVACT